jgi:deoxyguanosine kinase
MATAYIGLGSNLGDREDSLRAALRELAEWQGIHLENASKFYETKPLGGPPQPDFLNGAAELTTSLTPEALLSALLTIERRLGRQRLARWGPRVIDIDLLLFGDVVLDTDELHLPHPLMHKRLFVLEPLAEIAPAAHHPVQRKSVAEMLEEVRREGGAPDDGPRYLAVAGPIAAGKTTLALRLAAEMALAPVLEEPRRCPILRQFYEDRRKYALSTQLWFLMHRVSQVREMAVWQPARLITDYLFDMDLIFARVNLSPAEMVIYEAARTVAARGLAKPDVVIYRRAAPDMLAHRVEERGRSCENGMQRDYLAALCAAYDDFFSQYDDAPVVRIECDGNTWDFLAQPAAVRRVAEQVRKIPVRRT